MQQHSGQHILSAAFVRLFNMPTVSFHMADDYCSIDLETLTLTKEQIESAERLANEVILENRPVDIRFVARAEAERLGLRTAVVSSSDDDWIARHLGRLGHLEGLDAIVAANGDTERAKPRPDLYLEALDRLGLKSHEGIAFEDSPNGVTAAKAAGLFCIAVPNPITATLALNDADLVLESLADVPLPELLDRF